MVDDPAAARCSFGTDASKDSLYIFVDHSPTHQGVRCESALVTALMTAGLSVCCVLPLRVRSLARGGRDSAARRAQVVFGTRLCRQRDGRDIAAAPYPVGRQ